MLKKRKGQFCYRTVHYHLVFPKKNPAYTRRSSPFFSSHNSCFQKSNHISSHSHPLIQHSNKNVAIITCTQSLTQFVLPTEAMLFFDIVSLTVQFSGTVITHEQVQAALACIIRSPSYGTRALLEQSVKQNTFRCSVVHQRNINC